MVLAASALAVLLGVIFALIVEYYGKVKDYILVK
jgi:ABC-type dipeptide/oligopeptide/nickel transport system permease subunit